MILVVEDDIGARDVMCAALADEGFYAVPASTPEMALVIFASTPRSFDAVVTDIHFGGALDGWGLAEELRIIRADIPIVYVTGAARLGYKGRPLRRTLWLAKPFGSSFLGAAMRAFSLGPCASASAAPEVLPVNDA